MQNKLSSIEGELEKDRRKGVEMRELNNRKIYFTYGGSFRTAQTFGSPCHFFHGCFHSPQACLPTQVCTDWIVARISFTTHLRMHSNFVSDRFISGCFKIQIILDEFSKNVSLLSRLFLNLQTLFNHKEIYYDNGR